MGHSAEQSFTLSITTVNYSGQFRPARRFLLRVLLRNTLNKNLLETQINEGGEKRRLHLFGFWTELYLVIPIHKSVTTFL
jgi:hypothetical protein